MAWLSLYGCLFVSIMHQSIPPALDGKFPEVGTLELSNPPEWVFQ